MKRTIILFAGAALMLFAASCANRVIPGGGAIDHMPPVLEETIPQQGALHFSGKEIVITFNEFVQLKNAGDAIAISPPIEPAPKATVRKKSVVVELPDSLQPNTTYTIDFGDAISDLNEGNAVPGYQFVFSTGAVIDSLTLSGVIQDALTRKPVAGALAIAFPESIPDSLLATTRPSYFARAGENGTFTLSNMRPGSYRVFGLEDGNGNLRANLPDEKLGFLNAPATPGKDTLQLLISRHLPLKQRVVSSTLAEPGRMEIAFARPAREVTWQFVSPVPDKVYPFFNEAGDSLSLVFVPRADSAEVILSENGIIMDTVTARLGRGSNAALASGTLMMWNTAPQNNSILIPGNDPMISWMVPLTTFSSSKVTATRDTVPMDLKVLHDSISGRSTVFQGDWIPGDYRITLLPGAATDIYNRQNDTIRINFQLPSERSRGSLSFQVPPSETPRLIQLVGEKDEVWRQLVVPASGKGIFLSLDPGVFKLRLIEDRNGNHRWDAGDFREARQPEKVEVYAQPITVRANWELEVVWK